MKEIKLDLSKGKMNINEQLIEQGYRLSDKHEKMVLNEIKLLKSCHEQKLISEEKVDRAITNLLDFIILSAEEVQK